MLAPGRAEHPGHHVPRPGRPRQGLRCVRHRCRCRWRRCRTDPRRGAHRVPVLALVHVRQRRLRRCCDRRCADLHGGDQTPGPSPYRHRRHHHRGARSVRCGVRLRPGRNRRLGPPRSPSSRSSSASCLLAVFVRDRAAGGHTAAAAARCCRPLAGHGLRRRRHRRTGDVRAVPVPDLLPAAGAALQPGDLRDWRSCR